MALPIVSSIQQIIYVYFYLMVSAKLAPPLPHKFVSLYMQLQSKNLVFGLENWWWLEPSLAAICGLLHFNTSFVYINKWPKIAIIGLPKSIMRLGECGFCDVIFFLLIV